MMRVDGGRPLRTPGMTEHPPPGRLVTIEGVGLHFRYHALARFHERVRPGLERPVADAELMRLLPLVASLALEQPAWVNVPSEPAEGEEDRRTDLWVLLGDDVGFPVIDYCAVTCVVRGSLSEIARARRSEYNRRRRAALARVRGEESFARRMGGQRKWKESS